MDHLPDTGSPSKKLVVVSRTEVVKDDQLCVAKNWEQNWEERTGEGGMGRRGWARRVGGHALPTSRVPAPSAITQDNTHTRERRC
jgi:hypothetical protein